jgi:hypothetical protein
VYNTKNISRKSADSATKQTSKQFTHNPSPALLARPEILNKQRAS